MKKLCLLAVVIFLAVAISKAYTTGTTATSGITAATIETRVRRDLNEATAGFWNSSDIVQWIDEAQREIVNKTGCLQKSKYTVTLVENQWMYPIAWTGQHTGADNASILTDASRTTAWAVDALIGKTVRNTTDYSEAAVTDNDATTVTGTLSGGTDSDWDTNDYYIVNPFLKIAAVIHDSGVAGDTKRIFTLDPIASVSLGHSKEKGRPKFYAVWDNELVLWPIPDSDVSGTSMYVFEIDLPNEITASTDIIETPFYFDGAILNYVKAKACFKDKREASGRMYMALFEMAMAAYTGTPQPTQ